MGSPGGLDLVAAVVVGWPVEDSLEGDKEERTRSEGRVPERVAAGLKAVD